MSPDLRQRLTAAAPGSEWREPGGFGPQLRLANTGQLLPVCRLLAGDAAEAFDILEDYTALDEGEQFRLVLHFTRSAVPGEHLTVSAPLARTAAKAATLVPVYASAEWYEREIFDLFGIRFTGHPDLRRILLPDDWQGHPLRKDYTDERMLRRPGSGKENP
jgi:NADH-quinone oxidoreductase subunit C